MAKASKLFFSTDTEKQTLHRRISPTEKQQEFQQERWNDLCDYLTSLLQERTGYEIASWLQGSYKFKTQIRPSSLYEEFDIDLGIYFVWAGSRDQGNFSPWELKNFVQNALIEYAAESAEEAKNVSVPPKERCCRIHFTDNFHIDVPVYHLNTETQERSLATEKNLWEDSDPKALYIWFKEECGEESLGEKIRRTVKYLKMWVALNFDVSHRPSTILLTVLTVQSLKQIENIQNIEDDELFSVCITRIIDILEQDSRVLNPIDSSENLNRLEPEGFQKFMEGLDLMKIISERAIAANTETESAMIWQEGFKHFFPLPEETEEEPTSRALTLVEVVPEVDVTAQPRNNVNVRGYSGRNMIGPIPRECDIYFKVINTQQIPQGATVEWIARNEGDEAEEINDLGHSAGQGTSIKDSSAYNGIHYMDVVVKSRYGIPVGFRRIPVEIQGIPVPPRNPKRKPGYSRFKKRF